MIYTSLLRPEVSEFIDKNLNRDLSELALQKNPFPDIPWNEILNQIASKSKAAEKLPTWEKTPGILFPQKISVEQSSSETTAKYKAGLVQGKSLIDLTGGFGVDSVYFSKVVDKVLHCEMDETLSAIVAHNLTALNIGNVECKSGDSLDILQRENKWWDTIFVDPSRRHDVKGKVFFLKDCLPDVPSNLGKYFEYTDRVLMKTSPMLDISSGLSELHNVKEIHVVAINNEVKELLWDLEKSFVGKPKITAVNLKKEEHDTFSFAFPSLAVASYSMPKKFLYEPNAALLKAGGFDEISERLKIDKLHKHSHLYTSYEVLEFPGRAFQINRVLQYSKSEMTAIAGSRANVTVRNFPERVESIRKRWKIQDGGDVYCFFTTDINDRKIALICQKI